MGARENILKRIREARKAAGSSATQAELQAVDARFDEHPISVRPSLTWDLLQRFREQCVRMSSTVDDVASVGEVPAAVARYLQEKNLPSRAVCWPELASLDWASAGVEMQARPARGDDSVGVTGAYCGIAETGTLVFLSSPETHAATSLLPDTHIAVIPASRLVPAMEEAWALMRTEGREPPRAINLVSGPSRTADIEGQLQIGAHGPFRVHVIIVAR